MKFTQIYIHQDSQKGCITQYRTKKTEIKFALLVLRTRSEKCTACYLQHFVTCRTTIIFGISGQVNYLHYILGGRGIGDGCMKIMLIFSCLQWFACLFLFIMVEFEKVLYSPNLKMVLIFLVTKVFQKLRAQYCSNEYTFNSHMRCCQTMVSDKPGGLSECMQPPVPPGKLSAYLKAPFGDSCLQTFSHPS